MDINLIRSLTTVFSLGVFVALIVWTFKRSNKDAFAEAAELPFLEEGRRGDSDGEKQ